MNAFLFMVPLFLIRFGLLGLINPDALRRAAHFAPSAGNEKIALAVYQISNIFIILYPLALTIRTGPPLFLAGLAVYIIGICILAASTISFAKPEPNGFNRNGVYKLSRNPMYVGYFVYFLGFAAVTCSLPFLIALFLFQISAHWIILSEERWCIGQFGNDYLRYMNQVRRYI